MLLGKEWSIELFIYALKYCKSKNVSDLKKLCFGESQQCLYDIKFLGIFTIHFRSIERKIMSAQKFCTLLAKCKYTRTIAEHSWFCGNYCIFVKKFMTNSKIENGVLLIVIYYYRNLPLYIVSLLTDSIAVALYNIKLIVICIYIIYLSLPLLGK